MQLEKTIDLEENSPYRLLPRKKYISNRRLRISFNKAYVFIQLECGYKSKILPETKGFRPQISFSDFNHIGTALLSPIRVTLPI